MAAAAAKKGAEPVRQNSHESVSPRADRSVGKKAADLAKWIDKQQGPPPAKPMGGISGMPKGAVVYLPVDLPPGEYGLYCFLPDAKDGKMHLEHGMITQITVK